MTLAVGSVVAVRIDSLAAGGEGVGRVSGRAVFVPLSTPGDRIRARLTHVYSRYLRAEIVELVEAGPARRAVECPYFGRCGGCSWLHVDDAVQSEARVRIVLDALRRIAGLAGLPPVQHIPSPRTLGYRSRVRVAYAAGSVGFRARRSHQLVDVKRCLVLDEATQDALSGFRSRVTHGRGETEIRGYEDQVHIRGRMLNVSRGSFFQANRSLWDDWQRVAAAVCGSGGLGIELYAGVGFLTVELVQRFQRLVAVERSRAVHDARRNCAASVIHASVEAWVPKELAKLRPDLVLVNPPRVGCHKSVLDSLRESAPPRVVYVACDPATLARDLARLGPTFSIDSIHVLDALPQTHHVETIVALKRVDTT